MTEEPAADVRARARVWIAGDPDPATRGELQRLVDAGDEAALVERVDGTLEFGTAGIRGVVGAGPLRMNRAVVIRTTRGLADHLLGEDGDGPVIVGFDARTDSRRFADDVIGVLVAAGIPVRFFPEPTPTPLVAFAAKVLGARAAVVVTASHNPPEYNGYKVYAANAAQIVPPTDRAIADAIDAVGPASEVLRADAPRDHELADPLGDEVFARYLAEVDEVRTDPPADRDLTVVHTALHGVGWDHVRRALAHAGYTDVRPVPEQAEPDGRFPTVRFPNPEEPGALDLATALADDVGADLVVANDPDVDRLAVCLPDGDGWRALTGNQIGALLGDHVLRRDGGDGTALVVSTVVSSPMLGAIAEAYGAHYETTLTGFKWICNAALALEAEQDLRFVFGYEEALGYTVGPVVRDKDGIGAAVAFTDLAATCRADGSTVGERLRDLYRRHGLWVSHQSSVTRAGVDGLAEIARAMTRIGPDHAPDVLAGRAVTGVTDFRTCADARPFWLPATDLVALDLEGGSRALVRPSGTEPKLKVYVDLRDDLADGDDVAGLEASLRERAGAIAADLLTFVGLDG